MVGQRKKKYESGEGAQFMSRKAVLKKLQLSLNSFRRLCILKGIYPREPRNRKRAQQGKTGIKILYHKKDIQFLLHEPIIWKLRDYKIFNKKLNKAKSLNDHSKIKWYLSNHVSIKLDHIVKERYPTFIDALRDLDDCLTLCFLFGTFPSLAHIPRDQTLLCRRLVVEFMHAVIAAKALRKVFISIKGYYYQAEIKGQTITWIVPHNFCFEPQKKSEIDFIVMSTFVEFYTVLLGFVNFKLYHSLNLYYPPKLNDIGCHDKELVDEEAFVSERIAALTAPLISSNSDRTVEEEECQIDQFSNTGETDQLEATKVEAAKIDKLKILFKGLKFFINREVPREPLVFVLRCFGAEVSWDKTLFIGATFDENDETITHQIIDRPSIDKQYISRYYVQPQWVFDSVNARERLPVEKYLMGVTLPPHLSPFTDDQHDQVYIPPEARPSVEIGVQNKNDHGEGIVHDEEEEEEEVEENIAEETEDTGDEMSSHKKKKTKKIKKKLEKLNKEMKVKAGEITVEPQWDAQRKERQEYRLREKMIKKKHRNLYKSMMQGREKRAKEIWLLRKKRRLHDTAEDSCTKTNE
ncbi:pescadillo homolog [Orussus abietinus]|uniref:pescadillo homolog n=1 Tax=Orussus abietinus TaxID=222816 RepID=UPI000626C3E6|nr:pescadillo homolog [Orussus abietinus]